MLPHTLYELVYLELMVALCNDAKLRECFFLLPPHIYTRVLHLCLCAPCYRQVCELFPVVWVWKR